jgi:RNA polymerase sigma-70 factor (ECF subfamily)
MLSTIEGLKYREIAEVMECPLGTVMSRLFRSRRLLQDRLTDYAREVGFLPKDWTPAAAEPGEAP